MTVSVIVPVYRAQNTLDRCVESILSQLPPDGQLILVEDGSPDESGALCDGWAARDSRVTALHQKNGGAAAARNAGLEAATGEVIQFVDADDQLLPGVYDTLLPLMEAGAQLCFFACTAREDGRPEEVLPRREYSSFREMEPEALEHYLFGSELFSHPINKLYAAGLIRRTGARFDPSLRVNEDIQFNYAVMAGCGPFVLVPQVFYRIYTEDDGSLSRQFRTDLCSCARKVLPALEGFLASAGYSEEKRREYLDRFLAQSGSNQYGILASRPGPFAARKAALKELLTQPVLRRGILDRLARDPNRLPALPLRFCVYFRLSGLLAVLFQLRNRQS